MSYPKILTNFGKHGNTQILCQNEEQEHWAWLAMFHVFDQWTRHYDDLREVELGHYHLAKDGDWKSAQFLLESRSDYEYEGVEMQPASGPSDVFKQLNVVRCDYCLKFKNQVRMRSLPGVPYERLPGHICEDCDG